MLPGPGTVIVIEVSLAQPEAMLTLVVEVLYTMSDPGPAGPCGPVGPWAPVVPVAPVAPVAPVGPVAPVAPVPPVAPVAPVGPVGPGIAIEATNAPAANTTATALNTMLTFLPPPGRGGGPVVT